MATSTGTRYASQPVREYWGMVKDLDNSQKLELITLLAESMKPSAGKIHARKRRTPTKALHNGGNQRHA